MIISQYLAGIGFSPRVLVHVGAHRGEELGAYLALGTAHVVWIEGDPDIAAELRSIVSASPHAERQTVGEALITDRDGQSRPFYLFSNDRLSSSVFHATQVKRDRWPDVAETGDVLMLWTSRLDTKLRSLGIQPDMVDVIVFDIQGAELLALRGAGAYLESAQFIEVEVSTEEIYEGAPLVNEVREFLIASGFEQVTETPWHGDVVFRRTMSLMSTETATPPHTAARGGWKRAPERLLVRAAALFRAGAERARRGSD